MTGFGEAHLQQDGLAVSFELRTINSRYFKLTYRSPESHNLLEPEVEAVVRQQIKRGTVQANLRIDRARQPDDYRLNADVLSGYRQQLGKLQSDLGLLGDIDLCSLLQLPGVISESGPDSAAATAEWPLIRQALQQALSHLEQMRRDEGQAMEADLRLQAETIARELAEIETRAPLVSQGYRTRLEERIRKALADFAVSLNPADLIKEVSIFADRSDISEEIVRLRSHLVQFAAFLAETDSSGRKLEFLTQEMFRETNTIGSKANDIEIARHVIEIKAAIEKMREMIQNVE